MAAEVKSGAANATYVNNTTQNVRLIINYMSRVTSMTWSSSSSGTVNVTASATTIGKDIQNITGELRQAVVGDFLSEANLLRSAEISPTKAAIFTDAIFKWRLPAPSGAGGLSSSVNANIAANSNFLGPTYSTTGTVTGIEGSAGNVIPNLFYVPLTISRGGNFPVELMLAPTQSFSAVCGAFNFVAIREDGN